MSRLWAFTVGVIVGVYACAVCLALRHGPTPSPRLQRIGPVTVMLDSGWRVAAADRVGGCTTRTRAGVKIVEPGLWVKLERLP